MLPDRPSQNARNSLAARSVNFKKFKENGQILFNFLCGVAYVAQSVLHLARHLQQEGEAIRHAGRGFVTGGATFLG